MTRKHPLNGSRSAVPVRIPGKMQVTRRLAMDISEKNLESTIEASLLTQGYQKRLSGDYDRQMGLICDDTLNFIYATQPKLWDQFKQQFNGHVDQAKERFFARLTSELKSRGMLEVLRKGIKTQGCHFRLAFFRPANKLNPDLQQFYEGNIFSVVRQLHYSDKNNNSLDLVIFLNGLPLFTAELKNDF